MAYRVDVNGGSFCSTRISYVGFLEHPSVRVRWSVSVRLVYSWFEEGRGIILVRKVWRLWCFLLVRERTNAGSKGC